MQNSVPQFLGAPIHATPLTLGWMPQQIHVTVPEEDWTGSSSPAKRRRLQNRLNQRARRKRKAEQSSETERSPRALSCSSSSSLGHAHSARHDDWVPCQYAQHTAVGSPDRARTAQFSTPISGSAEGVIYDPRNPNYATPPCKLDPEDYRRFMDSFEQSAIASYRAGSPMAGHLFTLIKFNVHRAFVRNCDIIGISWDFVRNDEALSFFSNSTSENSKSLDKPMPLSLRPTQIQRKIPHHPWFDLIPVPGIRDNLIRVGEDAYDELELCADLVGFSIGASGGEGLIVWGESWDPSGWEVSEEFAKKWAWVLRGCRDLLDSTNRWRTKRGEQPLHWDISDPEPVRNPEPAQWAAPSGVEWQIYQQFGNTRITEIS